MSFALGIAAKAIFLVLLFGAARLIAMLVRRLMPDGKAKRLLFYDDGKFP
jgi:hypothetical protein